MTRRNQSNQSSHRTWGERHFGVLLFLCEDACIPHQQLVVLHVWWRLAHIRTPISQKLGPANLNTTACNIIRSWSGIPQPVRNDRLKGGQAMALSSESGEFRCSWLAVSGAGACPSLTPVCSGQRVPSGRLRRAGPPRSRMPSRRSPNRPDSWQQKGQIQLGRCSEIQAFLGSERTRLRQL